MNRGRFSQLPKWRQALLVVCLAYVTIVWALPVFMLPFVNVLPFVHERSVLERLPFSIVGSALLLLTLFAASGERLTPGGTVSGGLRQKAAHWVGVIAGLAMFTFSGAALSANIFGLAAKFLPHENYRSTVVIDSADHHGSRRGWVSLEYKESTAGEARHLVISRQLFDYPVLQPGDRVELRGERSLIGVYVTELSLL